MRKVSHLVDGQITSKSKFQALEGFDRRTWDASSLSLAASLDLSKHGAEALKRAPNGDSDVNFDFHDAIKDGHYTFCFKAMRTVCVCPP